MGRRGSKPFEEKIGIDRFKELLKRLDIKDIARLYCSHFIAENEKEKCKACRRSIYRAKKRVEQTVRAEKRYDPMEDFELIPEVQKFMQYHKKRKDIRGMTNMLRTMWSWVKDSELKELSRPALWDVQHLKVILDKLEEQKIATYHHKEALRRFFEAMANRTLEKHKLIKAHRKDMRSPKGQKRFKMRFTPQDLEAIVILNHANITDHEARSIKLHITTKAREGNKGKGSVLGIQWKDIDWDDNFYGFPMATVSVYEPKTSGGTWWRHIPLDLWWKDLSLELKFRYEQLGRPKEGYVMDMTYNEYLKLWHRISKALGTDYQPHDCRRSPSGWLRDLGLSDLALGQYDTTSGEAIGYTGVGWENSEIYYQRYGKMNPKAIYKKELKLDPAIFTGLIHKILENRAKRP